MKTGDLSLAIKARLLESVETVHGARNDLRARIHRGDMDLMNAVSRTVDRSFGEAVSSLYSALGDRERLTLSQACAQPLFRERVKQTALEALHGEALSPPLKIVTASDTRDRIDRLLRHNYILAVVAEYLPHLTNELYPLAIDAYVSGLTRRGQKTINVIGAHDSWLDEELRIRRCIVCMPEDDELIETPLASPLSPDAVLYLCVSPRVHQSLSERFERAGVVEVNPYRDACLADDKYACYGRWKDLGVSTPEAVLISRTRHAADNALEKLLEEAFARLFGQANENNVILVLQPNRGTEGRGVSALSGPGDWSGFLSANPSLSLIARDILQSDDLLVRRGVGNVLWRDAQSGADVCFDIRLNVIDGFVESGFFMIADENQVVTSPTKGGRVIEWKDGNEAALRVRDDRSPFALGGPEWQTITRMAERAAAIVPGCRMAGVDLRLEWRGGTKETIPWVLDINPRPAGLGHSRYAGTNEPGITRRLWDFLLQMKRV